ncbi:MAG: hypothetical protein OXK80_04725 [Bdellovibrionales bacterium]|nr:hypothetical protein [Bdellovibrionales bacterium]
MNVIIKYLFLTAVFLLSQSAFSIEPCEDMDLEIGETEVYCSENSAIGVEITYLGNNQCLVTQHSCEEDTENTDNTKGEGYVIKYDNTKVCAEERSPSNECPYIAKEAENIDH